MDRNERNRLTGERLVDLFTDQINQNGVTAPEVPVTLAGLFNQDRLNANSVRAALGKLQSLHCSSEIVEQVGLTALSFQAAALGDNGDFLPTIKALTEHTTDVTLDTVDRVVKDSLNLGQPFEDAGPETRALVLLSRTSLVQCLMRHDE